MCPLKADLLSVTFDPETAEIRLRPLRCNIHNCAMSSYRDIYFSRPRHSLETKTIDSTL